MASKVTAKPSVESPSSSVTVVTTCNLLEPYLLVRFPAATPVEVEKVTNWMQCQIDAGLMKVV